MAEISNIKSVNQNATVTARGSNTTDGRGTDANNAVTSHSAKADTVSLTNAATQLQSVQKKLDDVPVVNKERVETIKAAIADGSYQVDTQKLAQNLIDFEQQF